MPRYLSWKGLFSQHALPEQLGICMQNINFDLCLKSQKNRSESAFRGIMVLKIISVWERKKAKKRWYVVQFDLLKILEINVKPHQHMFTGINKSIGKWREDITKYQKKKREDNQCGIILIVVMVFYLYIHILDSSNYIY